MKMKELKTAFKQKDMMLEKEKERAVERADQIIKLQQDWSTSEEKKHKYQKLWQIELAKNAAKASDTQNMAIATEIETISEASET